MVKRHKLDELTPAEEEQLALLKRAFELVGEHRDELSRAALGNTNPVHILFELTQRGWLDKKDFEKLLGKGFHKRWMLEAGRRNPQDAEAVNRLRYLKKLIRQEMWGEVDAGMRPHPLDVRPRR